MTKRNYTSLVILFLSCFWIDYYCIAALNIYFSDFGMFFHKDKNHQILIEMLGKENIVISKHIFLERDVMNKYSIDVTSISDKRIYKIRVKVIILINREIKKNKYPVKINAVKLYMPLIRHTEDDFTLIYQQEGERPTLGNSNSIVLILQNNSFKVVSSIIKL
ncbi:MAG: hypothetical protein HRT87_08265 [Legionellales bacterium]|nr:hypothetical protein [Legionellales bacterium]